jgi:hypothetical protein
VHPARKRSDGTPDQRQPQPEPETGSGPQQPGFSEGAQQVTCSPGAQQTVGEPNTPSARAIPDGMGPMIAAGPLAIATSVSVGD